MSKFNPFTENKQYLLISLYVVSSIIVLFIAYQIIINFSIVTGTVLGLLGNIFSAISPLIVGLIIAYLLGPMVRFIDSILMNKLFQKLKDDSKKKFKQEKIIHTTSILITFLIVILAFCLVLYAFAVLIVGQLVFASLGQMVQSIIDYFLKYESILRDLIAKIPGSGLETQLQNATTALIDWISKHFSTTSILNFIFSLGGGILNIFLGTVVSLYVLLDAEFFKALWQKFIKLVFSEQRVIKINETLREVNVVIGQFLRGQLLDGLIIAILSSIGLSLAGLDFAVFIGCFAGIANIIPYFGPILGMIPAVIVALLTGGITQALLVVLILFIIQQIDGAIISPKVVGTSTGLHPVFVLTAILFAGYFWGIPGMIIAVPTAAIIKLFLVKRFGPVV
jgi:predicted PurR-regulated permease PerM